MREQKLMQRAKMYLDKMAQGIDPISGKPVPTTECICQERISKCLIYVSGILENLIDDNDTAEFSSTTTEQNPSIFPHSVLFQNQTMREEDEPETQDSIISQPSTVNIGSVVLLEDITTGKVLERKLVSSYSVTRYKTMGYRTKNYADVYQTSELTDRHR